MKRISTLFIFLILLFGCGQKSVPEGILSEDKMVNILIDIQMTEGMVSSLPIPFDSSQVLYTLMEKDVFIKHDVPDSVFIKSMIYYLEDPADMNRIYGRVIDSLTVLETIPANKQETP